MAIWVGANEAARLSGAHRVLSGTGTDKDRPFVSSAWKRCGGDWGLV